MNIIRRNKKNTTTYQNVQAGQVYEVCNTIYLKINPIYCDDGAIIDSIDLSTGEVQENFLEDEDIVVLLNTTLMIED